VFVFVLVFALSACGREGGVAADPGRSVVSSEPAAPGPRRGCQGKPQPPIGRVEASVVARPAPDRAIIEAHWKRGRCAGASALELVLPDGAWLVEGREIEALPPDLPGGVIRWRVGFREGEPLDAVLRLEGTTGAGSCSLETCVRLTGSGS